MIPSANTYPLGQPLKRGPIVCAPTEIQLNVIDSNDPLECLPVVLADESYFGPNLI
jgi:hypothetical protein